MTDSGPELSSGNIPIQLFRLGELVVTPGVLNAVPREELDAALARHAGGDLGELDEHDRMANDHALQTGLRIFSAYDSKAGIRFWIITEHDRSYTTFLLPQEY